MAQRHDMIVHRPHPAGNLAAHAPAPAYAPPLPAEGAEPSLLAPILHNWWLVLLFALFGICAALVYNKKAQPLYTSYAKIFIPPTSSAMTDAFGGTERSNFLATQVAVINSTTILQRVANETGDKGEPAMKDLKTFAPANGNVLYFLREQLSIELERKTDLIVISIDSPYPDEAARIVNSVVNEYTSYNSEEKADQSSKVLNTLSDKESEAQKKMTEDEAAIAAFKVANPTAALGDQNSAEMSNLSMISQKLTEAQLKLIDAKAAYGENHPVLRGLNAEVTSIQNLYDQAMDKVTRVKGKSAELQKLTSGYDRDKDFEAKLAERIHQLQITTGGRQLIDVQMIEPALVPDRPSSPHKHKALAIATVAGSLLGMGLALLRDKLDDRMKSVEDIQAMIGLPILGVVPAMTGRRTAVARAMTVHLDPRSVVAEAYRTIRTAIYFSTSNHRCKTLLLTSPEPGDGKTTSASNLAIAIAQTGRTVLLLDADFRKPTQHKNLDVKDSVGLSSVLAGRETLETAIQKTGVDGLEILPCGPIPANPSEILNSREFAELIDLMAEKYDHVIFDSPPVNRVTDAQILAAICDATILVLRADKSTRKSGEHARNQLLAVGARVLGAIVNDAPKRKGYDVYGGTYYGATDPSTNIVPSPRRLNAGFYERDAV